MRLPVTSTIAIEMHENDLQRLAIPFNPSSWSNGVEVTGVENTLEIRYNHVSSVPLVYGGRILPHVLRALGELFIELSSKDGEGME